jgi:O-antigen/teichoic acid export membrane protein
VTVDTRAPIAPRLDVKGVLARSAAWNYLGFAVNMLANLVLFPFVVARVGQASAGIWLLLGSIVGYMGLMELGLVPALTQSAAAARGRGDRDAIDRAASTALALLSAIAVLPLAVAANAHVVVRFLNLPAGLEREAVLVVGITVAGFGLRMPLAALQALLLASQRQDRCSQLWIVMAVTKLAGAFLVIGAGGGVVGLVLMEAIVHLAAGALQYRWVRQELPALRLRPGLVDWRVASGLVSFGGTLLLGSICVLLIEQTDRLVIGAFLPIGEVTRYSAGWKLYGLAYAVPTILVQALGPVAAELHGGGDQERMQRLFLRMTRYTVAVALPLCAILAACSPWLLRVWMGDAFVSAAVVVQVLVATFFVTAHNHAGYSILLARRQATLLLYTWNLPQAALNLALSLWLVRPLGIVGVALGTMIPTLLLQPVFFPRLLRELQVPWREFLAKVVWPTWGAAALTFWPLALAAARLDPLSAILPMTGAACSVAFAWVFWRGLSGEERRDLASHVPMAGERLGRLLGS